MYLSSELVVFIGAECSYFDYSVSREREREKRCIGGCDRKA